MPGVSGMMPLDLWRGSTGPLNSAYKQFEAWSEPALHKLSAIRFEERSPGRLSDAEDVTYYITSSLCNDLRSTVVHGPCKVLKTNSEPLHVVFWGRICFGKP